MSETICAALLIGLILGVLLTGGLFLKIPASSPKPQSPVVVAGRGAESPEANAPGYGRGRFHAGGIGDEPYPGYNPGSPRRPFDTIDDTPLRR
jgi:hypothetical protein